MTPKFDKLFQETSDSLHQWFKRGGTDPKTGKKFKGWVNCKTGGPCGRKSKKVVVVIQHADLLNQLVKVSKVKCTKRKALNESTGRKRNDHLQTIH